MMRVTFRVMPFVSLALVCAVVAVASCAGSREDTFRVPLSYSGVAPAKYLKSLECVPLDSTELTVSWLDTATDGNRLWVCRISASTSGDLSLQSKPTLVDHGAIKQARLFVRHGRYGLLYIKRNELILRWPVEDAPMRLTTRSNVNTCGAVGTPRHTIVLTVRSQKQDSTRATHRLVGYVVGEGPPVETELATIRLPHFRQVQPPIHLEPDGAGARVGLYLASGTVISGGLSIPSDSLRQSEKGAEFHRFDLVVDGVGRLSVKNPTVALLPPGQELERVKTVDVLDPSMELLAVAGPRQRLIRLEREPNIRRLSSGAGAASTEGTPVVQLERLTDSRGLVAWIDAARQMRAASPQDLIDPTAGGSDIWARHIDLNGRDVGPVPGFPVKTKAQGFVLRRLGNRNLLVWIQASPALLDRTVRPRELCLREL